jgi:hypothetical protein
MMNGDDPLVALAAEYPELHFRAFPDAQHDFLRVQCGRWIDEYIALPPDEKTRFAGFSGRVQRFHLKAFAADVAALAAKLHPDSWTNRDRIAPITVGSDDGNPLGERRTR